MGPYEKIICDANILYKAYRSSIKANKWKESTQRFSLNYLSKLFEIQTDLRCRRLKNGPVVEFFLAERGKVRPITSLCLRDQIVRHAVYDDIFMPIMKRKLIYDNAASMPGRGLKHHRARFLVHLRKYFKMYGNKGYILFGDFSKFYDNILHEKAKEDLLELVNHDDFMVWLMNVIFDGFRLDVSDLSDAEFQEASEGIFDKVQYRLQRQEKRNIPQGLKYLDKSINFGDLIGMLLGMYYPHRMDTYIKYVESEQFYGRFVDDWYIMSPSKERLEYLLKNIESICSEYGIYINKKKTKIIDISKSFKFLQLWYRMYPDGQIRVRIASSKVGGVVRKLKHLRRKYLAGDLPYEKIEEYFKSWMGAFYKLLTKKQRKSLLALYEDLFNVTITIKNRKMFIEKG